MLQLIPEAVSSVASYSVILAAFLIFQKNLRNTKKMSGIETDEVVYFEG